MLKIFPLFRWSVDEKWWFLFYDEDGNESPLTRRADNLADVCIAMELHRLREQNKCFRQLLGGEWNERHPNDDWVQDPIRVNAADGNGVEIGAYRVPYPCKQRLVSTAERDLPDARETL